MTADNLHEGDNEVVEGHVAPVLDRFFYYAGLVCIVAILALQCIK